MSASSLSTLRTIPERVAALCGAIVTAGLVTGCPADRLHSPTPKAPHLVPDDGAVELVESAPIETTLDHADVPNASDVWVEMIDRAKATIDFAEFYASEAEPAYRAHERLEPVIVAIERAVKRGVVVRFLADSVFAPKYPDTLKRLEALGVTVKILHEDQLAGGVLHAKYFVVDGKESYLGSQNFDWRALSHIQEMGVRATSPRIAGALLDVFDTDWALATGGAKDARAKGRGRGQLVPMQRGEKVTFVASPRGWLPDEAEWDLPRIVALLDDAKTRAEVQVLLYKTKDRSGEPFLTLDQALRRAAGRGVAVRLLVSHWGTNPGSDGLAALQDLAKVPNVEIRVITIPKWSGGDIPFARVSHAKYLVVDGGTRAWVGTSNWEGDYFTKSRNVGVIVEQGFLPRRLAGVFTTGWASTYTTPLP
ncbi:MAG: hypothetical protein JST00_30280 [Deltaproteobacteria bacterium]|nr:hypothetical protein [Deltaproteobacteria bacterium]